MPNGLCPTQLSEPFPVRQFKIKEVEIVRHVRLVAAHGEDSYASLNMPPEYNLMQALAVVGGYGF